MHAGRLVTVSAMRARVVRGCERADNKLPRLHGFHRASDFFDEAAVFVPHSCRAAYRLQASVWPEIRSANARGSHADHRIGRFFNLRILSIFEPNVTRSVQNSSLHL